MLPRTVVVAVLTATLLTAGLLSPATAAPPPELPATVAHRLTGLPAARAGTGLSQAVATPIPFSLIGFEIPRGADVAFRTSRDGRGWTPWTAAEIVADEGPDATSAEGRAARPNTSEPVWVGAATHLQTRVTGADPARVAAYLVDSAGLGRSWGSRVLDRLSAAWRGTPPPAAAAPARPAIVTRAQWGADESLRRSGPSYAAGIRFGAVHHTAGSNSYSSADAPAVVRGIYSYHVGSNGWSDIGYNFLVDRFGTVYEGRYGGVNRPVIGAHAGGFNTGSFGVSLMGNFEQAPPTAAARDALVGLLAWKYDVHHVDVNATTRYTSAGSSRYASGTTVTLRTLSGHRDVSTTACPGARVYDDLTGLRAAVVERQGGVLLDPDASPTSVRVASGASVDGPITFSTRLRPAGAWRLVVRGPSGEIAHTAVGSGTDATVVWSPAGATRGSHTWRFTSDGRRSARGVVNLVAPVIRDARADPARVRANLAGVLRTPVTWTAGLYPGANWRLTVTDPAGLPVHEATGRGGSLSTEWRGPVLNGGRYRWRIQADDVEPVTGRIRVVLNRLRRIGRAADPVVAAVQLSRRSFGDGSATVAVVTRGNRYTDALAAAPLAGRAGPLLYTDVAALPDGVGTELTRVLPAGATVYLLGDDAEISSAVSDALAQRWTVVRIGGSRAATAAAVAAVVAERSGTRTALVADGAGRRSWSHALAAAAWGADRGVPVLLADGDRLPAPTLQALTDLRIRRTVVVGPSSSVSDAVLARLPRAERVGGARPSVTAARVATSLWGRTTATSGDTYVFVNGAVDGAWARAAAAAPAAARAGAPVLLARDVEVPTATAGYLSGLDYRAGTLGRGDVVGPRTVISADVRDALSRLLQ